MSGDRSGALKEALRADGDLSKSRSMYDRLSPRDERLGRELAGAHRALHADTERLPRPVSAQHEVGDANVLGRALLPYPRTTRDDALTSVQEAAAHAVVAPRRNLG